MKKLIRPSLLLAPSIALLFLCLSSCSAQSFLPATLEELVSEDIQDLTSFVGQHLFDSETLMEASELFFEDIKDIEEAYYKGTVLGEVVDPDTLKTPLQMMTSQGFTVEIHEIQTADNYTLTAWRLYQDPSSIGTPVILNHGFFDSSFTWILNNGNESLAYMLGYLGYDVWLTNNRGNRYSQAGDNTSIYDQYWAFSWDEMAKYDLPANIQYVLKATNSQKLHYVGHSEGTTQMFAAIALDPSIQNLLKSYTGLGPISFVNHATGIVRTLVNLGIAPQLLSLFESMNLQKLWVDDTEDSPGVGIVCDGPMAGVCSNFIELICGETTHLNTNSSRVSVMASHEPGGSSLQNLMHWYQAVSNENFQMYDFGSPDANMAHYGQPTPPIYNVSNFGQFTVPGFMVQGSDDTLSVPEDLARTLSYFPEGVMQQMTVKDYGHLDYCWSDTANQDIYTYVVQFISSHE